jgi:hypothetical protein
MLNIALFLLLSCSLSNNVLDQVKHDSCDIIELNHYYGNSGLVFKQLIFRTWSKQLKYHFIVDYRIYKDHMPLPIRSNGGYVLRWHDLNVYREVRAKQYIETHSRYDPEVSEARRWYYLNRKELSK